MTAVITGQLSDFPLSHFRSYFAQYELVNMNASLVTQADIYIVTFLGEETK